jgi:parvulin-like peptidyl-prolyl isomerase
MKKKTIRFVSFVSAFVVASIASSTIALADEGKPLGPNVVARQGGVEVTMLDVDAAAAKIPEGDRAGFFDSPKRIEAIVGGLLYQKQLAAEARKAKVEKDALVQREIAQATDDVLSRVQLENYQKSLTLPDFNLLAKEFYASHKSNFVEAGGAAVADVVIAMKGRSDEEARARASEVEAAARAHPDQFEALVAKYSDDPNKLTNHGRMERYSNQMAKPLAAAANALTTPGDISPVVKTELAYHVLKLIERKPDRQRPFEEIQADLLITLKRNYVTTQMDQYTGEFRGKPLQANPDLVASLRTRYATPAAGDMLPLAPDYTGNKPAAETPPAH